MLVGYLTVKETAENGGLIRELYRRCAMMDVFQKQRNLARHGLFQQTQ